MCLYAAFWQGGYVFFCLLAYGYAPAQHLRLGVRVQLALVLRGGKLTQSHLQGVGQCYFVALGIFAVGGDVVGVVQRQGACGGFGKGGWELYGHACQVGVDADFWLVAFKLELRLIAACAVQEAPQCGQATQCGVCLQACAAKLALGADAYCVAARACALLARAHGLRAAFKGGCAAQQVGACAFEGKAAFVKGYCALAACEQGRGWGDADVVAVELHGALHHYNLMRETATDVVAVELHGALHFGGIHVFGGQAQAQINIGLPCGCGLVKGLACDG